MKDENILLCWANKILNQEEIVNFISFYLIIKNFFSLVNILEKMKKQKFMQNFFKELIYLLKIMIILYFRKI